MKILIISGFLGAGKTTFIQSLVKETGKDFAILENEYGAENIDSQRFDDRKINIWELTENCICCSGKADLANSVLTIANAIDPEYLIIEPTGVGKLSNIITNLQKIQYEKISILFPITIVDINSVHQYSKEYADLYLDQIENSGTLILSKSENFSNDEKQEVKNYLRTINKSCTIFTEHYSSFENTDWLNLLNKDLAGQVIKEEREAILLDSFALNAVYMDNLTTLIFFLEQLVRNEFGKIVRAKGQLKVQEEYLQFDVSNNRYSITNFDGNTEGKVVFIGENIDRIKIRRNFTGKYKGVKLKKIIKP